MNLNIGDQIKLYGARTIITGFHASYNEGLEKWETIILTTGRGDPFERTLGDIEVYHEGEWVKALDLKIEEEEDDSYGD